MYSLFNGAFVESFRASAYALPWGTLFSTKSSISQLQNFYFSNINIPCAFRVAFMVLAFFMDFHGASMVLLWAHSASLNGAFTGFHIYEVLFHRT